MRTTSGSGRARPALVPTVALGLLALVVVAAVVVLRDGDGGNPFAGRDLHRESSPTALLADSLRGSDPASAEALDRIAEVPQGIWLQPETDPAGEVGDRVRGISARAAAADAVALLVVYGVPQRDCADSLSAGGLTAADYPGWVEEVATGADPDHTVVVIEPDALATVLTCGDGIDRAARIEALSTAVAAFADAGVPAYVDAGHSHWLPAQDMADLLEEVGVSRVRGFSTNVSNYQTDSDERAYAEEVVAAVGSGAHYVVDSGRNGNGGTDEWCNPPGMALGPEPGVVDDSSAQDARLWIKPPAESDGTCAGGPVAGEVWSDRARDLVTSGGSS